jgi:hypothetical protein
MAGSQQQQIRIYHGHCSVFLKKTHVLVTSTPVPTPYLHICSADVVKDLCLACVDVPKYAADGRAELG